MGSHYFNTVMASLLQVFENNLSLLEDRGPIIIRSGSGGRVWLGCGAGPGLCLLGDICGEVVFRLRNCKYALYKSNVCLMFRYSQT